MRASVARGLRSPFVRESTFTRYWRDSVPSMPCVLIQGDYESTRDSADLDYIKEREPQLLEAVKKLRKAVGTDLWCRASVNNGRLAVTAYTVMAPTPGIYLANLYNFVVGPSGEPEVPDVFTGCLNFSKFSAPPCSTCKFDECLSLNRGDLNTQLLSIDDGYAQSKKWGAPSSWELSMLLGNVKNVRTPHDQVRLNRLEDDELQRHVDQLWEAIKGIPELEVVPTKYAVMDMFAVVKPAPMVAELFLSPEDIQTRKDTLNARSKASAETRNARKKLCSSCFLAPTCSKDKPAKCMTPVTEEEVKSFVTERVRKHFGEVPTGQTLWIQQTAAVSGATIKGRIGTKYGVPTKWFVSSVKPEGTVMLAHFRTRSLHAVKISPTWSTWKPQELDLLLQRRPTFPISDDQALMMAYMMMIGGWRRPFGSWDRPVTFRPDNAGGVEVTTACYRTIKICSWLGINNEMYSPIRRQLR